LIPTGSKGVAIALSRGDATPALPRTKAATAAGVNTLFKTKFIVGLLNEEVAYGWGVKLRTYAFLAFPAAVKIPLWGEAFVFVSE
jgi:hypothetical protein